jgi:TPR repeat protein
MYRHGEGVDKAPQEAARFYRKTCDMGSSRISISACYGLAKMYATGEGVVQSLERAEPLFQKACDARYSEACTNLAIIRAK